MQVHGMDVWLRAELPGVQTSGATTRALPFRTGFEVSGSLLGSELGRVGLPVLAFRRRADSSSLSFLPNRPLRIIAESSQI